MSVATTASTPARPELLAKSANQAPKPQRCGLDTAAVTAKPTTAPDSREPTIDHTRTPMEVTGCLCSAGFRLTVADIAPGSVIAGGCVSSLDAAPQGQGAERHVSPACSSVWVSRRSGCMRYSVIRASSCRRSTVPRRRVLERVPFKQHSSRQLRAYCTPTGQFSSRKAILGVIHGRSRPARCADSLE